MHYNGDNRIVFEDLPTYIGGLSVAGQTFATDKPPIYVGKSSNTIRLSPKLQKNKYVFEVTMPPYSHVFNEIKFFEWVWKTVRWNFFLWKHNWNQSIGLGEEDFLRFCTKCYLGDNRIVFEDLPTYIGGLYIAKSRLTCSANASKAKLNLRHSNHRYTSANLQKRYSKLCSIRYPYIKCQSPTYIKLLSLKRQAL